MRAALERAGVEPGGVAAVWAARSGLAVADEAESRRSSGCWGPTCP